MNSVLVRSAAIRAQWQSRLKYRHTPETDAIIREAYHKRREFANPYAIRSAAAKLGWPRHAITQRARVLGVTQAKEKPWTRAELDLLDSLAHFGVPVIARKFRRAGYSRTETAICLKRKRLGIGRRNLDGWSARQFADLLGIDVHKVSHWIRLGMLTCIRRGTQFNPFFIQPAHARRFILHHPNEIDLARVEKFWLLDVVSGGKLCEEFRAEACA